jgi:ankyrin repeat protein
LNHGAKVNARDHDGQTAVMWACAEGHYDAVVGLLGREAKLDLTTKTKEMNALYLAAQFGQVEIVKLLLKHGADVKHKLVDGKSVLFAAVSCLGPTVTSSRSGSELILLLYRNSTKNS